ISLVLADDVCAGRSSRSTSSTERPRPAGSRAMPAPLMPPPTIKRSQGFSLPIGRSQVYRMRYDLPSDYDKRHAMNIVPEIAALDAEMRDWRHRLHAHPETAFEETATSAFVAATLRSFGLDMHTGLAGTGVVGVLRNGDASTAVGLRADLDALHIHETSGVPHASKVPGKMHACGHDGHTTMLLAAAKAMTQRKRFDGTAYFIFQPAEENEGGGRVMVEQGLFDKFPMQAVYGMHNWPGMPAGTFAVRAGPLMGAFDIFEIVATG